MEADIRSIQDYLSSEIEKIHIKELKKSGINMNDYLLKLKEDYKSYMKMYKVLFNKPKLRYIVVSNMELMLMRYKIITEEFL